MTKRWGIVFAVIMAATMSISPGSAAQSKDDLAGQVRAAEAGFAKTMASRDRAGFAAFVSPEAVFFGRTVLRGRATVVDGWSGFFTGPVAPFSWRPEIIEVLDSGTLALSSGPVMDPSGKTTGMFNSIWRRESDGKWRVIFDKGCD